MPDTIKMVCRTCFFSFAFVALSAPNFSTHYYFNIVCRAKWQHRLPLVMNICTTTDEAFINITSFAQIIVFVIAFIFSIILYFLIIRRLSNRNIAKGGQKGDQQKQADKVRKGVTRMLIITGIVFLLCLAPLRFYKGYLLADGQRFLILLKLQFLPISVEF